MHNIPEEAVKAAAAEIRRAGDTYTEMAQAAITAALPFLPVQGAVKKLAWTKGVVDIAQPMPGMKYVACNTTPKGSWAWWLDNAPETRGVFTSEEAAKAAAQADYERRILAAIEAAPPLSKLKAENARMKAQLAEARKALEPFALVAEHDIGDDETDSDAFRPMPEPFNHAPEITVGHLRAARRALEGGEGND